VLVLRVPRGFVELFRLPRPTLLDAYVGKAYLRVLLLAFAGLLGIFYIGSFIDWSDNLFKGQATTSQLAQYMWYSTPQFVYYVLPLSALVGTLVTNRAPHQVQRADHHARLRRQPVSHGAAPAGASACCGAACCSPSRSRSSPPRTARRRS
jgi:hypothetical protein